MKRKLTFLFVVLVLSVASLVAEEGMWTLDNFPHAKIKDAYGVEIDDAWLARVQHATTRIEGGCSGSFVSPEGLVRRGGHTGRFSPSRWTTDVVVRQNWVSHAARRS